MQKAIVLKKSEALDRPEVVMPSEDLITRIVNERIAEVLAEAETADLRPFFERAEVAKAIRRRARCDRL